MNGFFNGFWTQFGIILSLKYSLKFNRKSMHFLLGKTSKIHTKMTSFWEARGDPTNQLFAPWTHVGGTLAPQGTPGCPREGPDIQRAKYSKIGAQNHSKPLTNYIKIHENWNPRPLKIMETKLKIDLELRFESILGAFINVSKKATSILWSLYGCLAIQYKL